MKATLDLLYVGTIRRLFRPAPVAKPSPLDLPTNDHQCVHVEVVFNQADHTTDFVRCNESIGPRGGFLCYSHDFTLLGKKRPYVPERDYRAEAVENVILTDRRAIARCGREVVGLKTKIQFIKDVRMKADVDLLGGQFEHLSNEMEPVYAADDQEGSD